MSEQPQEPPKDRPAIAEKTPIGLDLEPGTYWWCACGRSKGQPFCDGSHKSTAFSPLEFTLSETKKVFFCRCKQTGTPPLCDGSHRSLE